MACLKYCWGGLLKIYIILLLPFWCLSYVWLFKVQVFDTRIINWFLKLIPTWAHAMMEQYIMIHRKYACILNGILLSQKVEWNGDSILQCGEDVMEEGGSWITSRQWWSTPSQHDNHMRKTYHSWDMTLCYNVYYNYLNYHYWEVNKYTFSSVELVGAFSRKDIQFLLYMAMGKTKHFI